MNKLFRTFLICIFLVLSIVNQLNCDELRTVFLIHRHGDRSPPSLYPTDEYKNGSFCRNEFNQLTNKGKLRMFNIGRFLREEYADFLTYNIREAYIRSSNKERCLESTELLLNGIYKPEKGSIYSWNDNELWLPVSVITKELKYDHMMNLFSTCSAGEKELKKVFESDFIQNFNSKNKDLYKKLTQFSGMQIDDQMDGDVLYDILDKESEMIENFKYPEWATEEVLKALEQIHLIKFQVFGHFESMLKLRFGLFLNEITEKITKVLNENSKKDEVKKLNVYSSHDIFIYNLMKALNIPNNQIPQYGSALIIELYENRTSIADWDTLEDKERYTVREFLSSFSHLLMENDEMDEQCRETNKAPFSTSYSVALVIVILFESILILLFLACLLRIKCRAHKNRTHTS